MNIPAEKVRQQILSLLTSWGVPPDIAETTAQVMIETDLAGVDSHGVSMLMDYEGSKTAGKLNVKARARVVRQNAVTALIDADAGFGHPASVMAMKLAMEKARAMGVGVVTVFNSHHFGAAGYYAAMASREGLLGMVTSATRTMAVVPTRSRVGLLGTNPIAFSAPAGKNNPFLLDMATATVANGKVKVYDLNGKPIPRGWVQDERGEPITDAGAAFKLLYDKNRKGGGLAPLGGTEDMSSYKGYGLALMVHILGGTLSGASFSPIRVKTQKPGDPDRLGHFFLAIDPKAFRPDGGFEDDLDAVIDVLHASEPVDPAKPVLVPGDPEAATKKKRLREGIPIPATLAKKIHAICERSGVPFLLGEA
jgi:LDH2 family malate/lactate/ureidoglycolate dehydrogenase